MGEEPPAAEAAAVAGKSTTLPELALFGEAALFMLAYSISRQKDDRPSHNKALKHALQLHTSTFVALGQLNSFSSLRVLTAVDAAMC